MAGQITWKDLTVSNAEEVRDFYKEVVGWTVTECDMGGYADYGMNDPDGETQAGICHARGVNSNIPPQWLVYITVDDLDASISKCLQHGGSIVDGPREMGGGQFCVIRDPAGAICALYMSE